MTVYHSNGKHKKKANRYKQGNHDSESIASVMQDSFFEVSGVDVDTE